MRVWIFKIEQPLFQELENLRLGPEGSAAVGPAVDGGENTDSSKEVPPTEGDEAVLQLVKASNRQSTIALHILLGYAAAAAVLKGPVSPAFLMIDPAPVLFALTTGPV